MMKPAATVFCLLLTTAAQAQAPADLPAAFQAPPQSARPRVWWHWMQGNITRAGIRQDLLWMQRSGIGGFQNFDANLATPQVVSKRLAYMTPEWKDAFRYTTRLTDSLHLEMGVAGSPGWSESGGPWVKPEDGMKKVVWTETRVKGGTTRVVVPKPSGVAGPFQNIPKQPEFGMTAEPGPSYYQDVAVIAYKLPEADKTLSELGATVTSSGGRFQLAQLTDGDLGTTALLPPDAAHGFAWIQFAFPRPQTIRAITMVGGGSMGNFGMGGDAADARALEASDDGVHFKPVSLIPRGAVLQQTVSVPETTARYFRVTVKTPPPIMDMAAVFMGTKPAPPKSSPGTEIAEIVLHPVARVNRFEEKAAFAPASGLHQLMTLAAPNAINPANIIDLTGKLDAAGTLSWAALAGSWMVVRFGYSLTGIVNHPATPEATGLEVDKLDPVAVKKYFSTYLDMYQDATGGLMGSKGGLQYLVTDSWEAGAQNWTPNLPQEFQKRRGYSLLPWLPVLTGHVVKTAQASEQFLFDYRQTLSDLVAAYHYDALTDILAARGLKRYTESHEVGRALIADGMEVKRRAAVPMSAMWTPSPIVNGGDQTGYQADDRESASVAHLYGQNLAAAESMTAMGLGGSAYSYAPENLKPTADLEFASGINRIMIHSMVHQPVEDKLPGLGLGPFGQWFNRHETWADQASAWTSYLARTSYMLQQGRFVADIVYYYGEGQNITDLFGKQLPRIPEGYNYDFINADALVHLLSVKNGKLVTPSGMSYRVLVLDSSARQMSVPVLRKLHDLVKAGATVAGMKPVSTPSLSDDPQEFQRLVGEIWGGKNPNVSTGKSLGAVLASLQVAPDFAYAKPQPTTKLLYVHRTLPDGEVYWVNSRNDASQLLEATFRVAGRAPQLWHPETGKMEAASYTIANGLTKVTLPLAPNDAVFVVFRNAATKPSFTVPVATEQKLAAFAEDWQVAFQPNRGAPASASFTKLASYTENSTAGIKYFSGTAIYTKTITAPARWFGSNGQLWLDLGEVKNLAEVVVNGQPLGVVWKKPFRVDVTNALKPGNNQVEIKVTSLWVNRLVGDAQPGVTGKITYTSLLFYQADAKLLPSGLLGPVVLLKQ
ncbi:MAG: glycoside hydrolase [Hymenobacter sp.]|nr:glycoside hydrolase [Hymenobacter sp.]